MLDGLFKARQDRFWDRAGRVLARWGLSPNQVTVLGCLASLVNSGAYALHQHTLVFGLLMILTELLDDLDGAVARVTNRTSKLGAYLDAATDRYKEVAALAAVAYVHDLWPLCFAAAIGSLITSYNKARAGMEIPVSNADWPDLFERLERVVILIAGLVLEGWFPKALLAGQSPIRVALIVIAVGSILTSLQRLRRASRLIKDYAAGQAANDQK
ncbi:MAG: CDP-alcohol phosphatidyltransferase family protein [Planctomycetota bacterium]|jgi:phosphatidylglycerophosphate synthase